MLANVEVDDRYELQVLSSLEGLGTGFTHELSRDRDERLFKLQRWVIFNLMLSVANEVRVPLCKCNAEVAVVGTEDRDYRIRREQVRAPAARRVDSERIDRAGIDCH